MKDKDGDIRGLLQERWGAEIYEGGFTAVPNLVLDYVSVLGLTEKDQRVVLRVFRDWDLKRERWPQVSVQTLSREMRMSVSAIYGSVRRLVRNGHLARTRSGRTRYWDFSGLFENVMQQHRRTL